MRRNPETSIAAFLTFVAIAVCSPALQAQDKAAPGPLLPLADVMRRAATVHNAALLSQRREWTAEGTITIRTSEGKETKYPVTVLHKGADKVQRIVKYPGGEVREGTDGTSTWAGIPFGGPASGAAMRFIESQTVRSVNALFGASATSMRDAGVKGDFRGVEVVDAQGRKTTFFLHPITGLVARSEVVIGETQHMISGEITPDIETYAYSDYRNVNGVLTPFRIEIHSSGSVS